MAEAEAQVLGHPAWGSMRTRDVGNNESLRRKDRDFWDILIYGEGCPFGSRRRQIVRIIAAVGILTFFTPLMTTKPPVLGRTYWSLFEMFLRFHHGELPPSHTWNWALDIGMILPSPLLDLVIIYFLMLCLLVVLHFPEFHPRIAMMAAIGLFITWEMWRWCVDDFEEIFYGQLSYGKSVFPLRHVGLAQLMLALLAVFGSVLYVAVDEDIDPEYSSSQPQTGDHQRDAEEPKLLDAEFVSSEDNRDQGLGGGEILPPETKEKLLR